MSTRKLLLYVLVASALSVLLIITGCENYGENARENADVKIEEKHDNCVVTNADNVDMEKKERYNVNGTNYANAGAENKCDIDESSVKDGINRDIAEDFAIRRFHLRSDEMVFYALDRINAGENNSYEVFLKCIDTDAIEKLVVYIENGRVIKYEHN